MKNRLKYDRFWVGLIAGIAVPVVVYALLLILLDLLDTWDLVEYFRPRTTMLIAICSSIIPFQYFRRHRFDQAMRGMVFTVLALTAYWLYENKYLLGL